MKNPRSFIIFNLIFFESLFLSSDFLMDKNFVWIIWRLNRKNFIFKSDLPATGDFQRFSEKFSSKNLHRDYQETNMSQDVRWLQEEGFTKFQNSQVSCQLVMSASVLNLSSSSVSTNWFSEHFCQFCEIDKSFPTS